VNCGSSEIRKYSSTEMQLFRRKCVCTKRCQDANFCLYWRPSSFSRHGLRTILQFQVQRGAAFVHTDIKQTWAASIGAWVFHQARMREPLARHDGVLSAAGAHSRRTMIDTVQQLPHTHEYGLFDGRHSILPFCVRCSRSSRFAVSSRRYHAPSVQRYEVLR
jgi:hypothetical protein